MTLTRSKVLAILIVVGVAVRVGIAFAFFGSTDLGVFACTAPG